MKQLSQLFMYEGRQVRTVMKDGDPWFVLKDLCDVLEISHAPALKQRLSDDVVSNYPIPDSIGRMQDTLITNEDGLYDVILESRKNEARAFRKWVTSEVLPTIRKTGSYSVEQPKPSYMLDDPIERASKWIEEMRHTKALELKIETDRSKVVFAESLETASNSILIGHLAKLLKQNGIDIGQNRLFDTLRKEGYLMRRGSDNVPTQRSMDLKIMEIKMGSRQSSSEGSKSTITPKVTGKGQFYFINKFKSMQQIN